MDTGLMNHTNENFCSSSYLDDSILNYPPDFNEIHDGYDWDEERESNSETELLTIYPSYDSTVVEVTDSPPSELFQKTNVENLIEANDAGSLPSINNFDLEKYINTPDKEERKYPKAAGKKIDLKAQKYIIEDDHQYTKNEEEEDIDVETINEENNGNPPVLEAFDPISLLEKFEASENASCVTNYIKIDYSQTVPPKQLFENDEDHLPFSSNNRVNSERLREDSNARKSVGDNELKVVPKTASKSLKNKQIVESLPKDLIKRIKESGKRKQIKVIDPIPTKKRRLNEATQQNKTNMTKAQNEQVKHDHSYCDKTIKLKETKQKDSGFQSSEDDERNNILKNQPIIKTQDGKLMVSLLKVNTINTNKTNVVINENNKKKELEQQKKKLNLEEYKKRRTQKYSSSNNSSSCSSLQNSNCSSPIPVQEEEEEEEDENLKLIRHQNKLMKMAQDLLKAVPNRQLNSNTTYDKVVKCETIVNIERKPRIVRIPSDLEMKTVFNVGCNTDFNDLDSIKQLEEINPILQNASDKITNSSFINSLIQNIPKIKINANAPNNNKALQEIVREDKTIRYLSKDRPQIKTTSVECQTNITLISERRPRYRRRSDSCSSKSSSNASYDHRISNKPRSRHSSHHSHSPSSSVSSFCTSSSYTSYSSESRSRSHNRRSLNDERLREVEERRVIYIGRILNGTRKDDLRRRFIRFGPITHISLHFRNYGHNYGFVTFANKQDAYEAVGHGNDGSVYPKYDLSFGGRRIFCQTSYSDLDNMPEDYYTKAYTSPISEIPFDLLLQSTHEEICRRKKL